MKQEKSKIVWENDYIPYVLKEVVLACPDCGRDIEALLGICLDNVGTPFVKTCEVCKCGYVATLDEILIALDEQEF